MSPDLLHAIIASIGAIGTIVSGILGHRHGRRSAVPTEQVKEEVERLYQLFRIVEAEKRQLVEMYGGFQARCLNAECPNHPSKQSATRNGSDGVR